MENLVSLRARTGLLLVSSFVFAPLSAFAESLECTGVSATDNKTEYAINIDMDKPSLKSTIRYVLPDGSSFQQGLGIDKRIFTGGKTRYVDSMSPEKYLEVEYKDGAVANSVFNHPLSGFNSTAVSCSVDGDIAEKPACTPKSKLNSKFIESIRHSNNLDEIASAFECEADVNYSDKNGCTPLMFAIDSGCGISGTPVHGPGSGVFSKTTAIVDFLLNNGALVDTKDKSSETALIKAAKFNVSGVYESFLASEADFNAQDAKGYTTLMYAVENGNLGNVQDILQADPDRTLTNSAGKTAYDIAKQWNREEIAALVETAAAKVLVTSKNDGTCSPLSIALKQGRSVEISLKASSQMALLEAKGLNLSLMAGANGVAKKTITPTTKGRFPFTCGFHGGSASRGTFVVQ